MKINIYAITCFLMGACLGGLITYCSFLKNKPVVKEECKHIWINHKSGDFYMEGMLLSLMQKRDSGLIYSATGKHQSLTVYSGLDTFKINIPAKQQDDFTIIPCEFQKPHKLRAGTFNWGNH